MLVKPVSVVAADVNGDSKPDLIVAHDSALENRLTVLTNNGSGGFVLAANPTADFSTRAVTAADVNGDGKPDLITANPTLNSLRVLTNNGSGGFLLAASPGTGSSPVAVIATDVNEDGRMDLVSVNAGANTLTVLTNNGAAVFFPAAVPATGVSPSNVAAADFNGDGHVDLVTADLGVSTHTILLNTPASYTAGFSGNGSGLTALNAASLTGTVAAAQIPGLDAAKLTTGTLDAARVPDLDAGKITTGTLAAARIPNLDGAKITSGTVADGRLSGNVALVGANQTFTGVNTFSGTFLGSAPYLKYVEAQTGTVDAGGNTAGVNTRNFTSEVADTHNQGSLSGGAITLAAGTYQCRISAPGYRVDSHQIRLRTTGGTTLLYGSSEYSDDALSPGVQTRSQLEGQITLAAQTTLQVQHFMTLAKTVNGLGLATSANWGDGTSVEIYAVAEFWKIK